MAIIEARESVPQSTQNSGEKKRRGFKVTSLVGRSIVTANMIASLIAWRNSHNEVSPISYEGPPAESIGIVARGLGGFGQGGKKAAQRMAETSLGNHPWFSLEYDNLSGINPQSHANQLLRLKNNPESAYKEMDALTLSMGIILALEVAQRTHTPIRTLVAIDPATHINDARYGKLGVWIAKNIPDLGLLGKFGLTLIADTGIHGFRKTPQNIKHSGIESVRGTSTELIRSGVLWLDKSEFSTNPQKFKDVIIPGVTKVIWVAPGQNGKFIDTDGAIYPSRAFARAKPRFEELGAQVFPVYLPPEYRHLENFEDTMTVVTPLLESLVQQAPSTAIYENKSA